jgi:8-oxo-dGTP pyrophosphatase MutT (NUDIX family)
MVTFKKGHVKFIYRVAAVIIDQNRVLLHRAEGDSFWALPGGKPEMMEISSDALQRELREELGTEVQIERLLWLVENFFTYHKRDHHEIGFYFLAHLPQGSPFLASEGPFNGIERFETKESFRLIFQWFSLDPYSMKKVDIRPAFLNENLLHLPDHIQTLNQFSTKS